MVKHHILWATVLLCCNWVAGCSVPAAREARYTGQMSGCGPDTPATLTRIADTFAFAPSDGVLILRGKVAADGGFAGTLNTQPPGKPPYLLQVSGKLDGEHATVSYATPSCRAAGTLARVHAPLL